MVKTRSQKKKEEEEDVRILDYDTKPMDISDDEPLVLTSSPLSEVLLHSSSDPDIQLPPFHNGSLREAIDAAFSNPPDEAGGRRRLLLLFLYSDSSAASEEFVREVICHQEFRHMVGEVAEMWGQDVREQRNMEVVEMMLYRELGEEVVELVRGFRVENFPLLVVLERGREGIQASQVFFAGVRIDEVVKVVMNIMEMQLERIETEKDNLDESRAIRTEQEREFGEAVLQDQIKMKKKTEEEFRMILEQKMEEEEQKQMQEEAAVAKQQLVDEPGEEEAECINVRVKMAREEVVERMFRKKDTVKNIMDFVVSQGVRRGKFRLIFWPNVDIARVEEDTLVGDVFIGNRVMLMLVVLD